MASGEMVREVLLALAGRFDRKSAGAQGGNARNAWAAAARIARDEAEPVPQPPVEPGTNVSEGGEAEAGRIGLRAATIAIERELDSGDIYQTHIEHDEHLARVALEAAEPLIRNDERERITNAVLSLLNSGPIGRVSCERYVRADYIREALGVGPDGEELP